MFFITEIEKIYMKLGQNKQLCTQNMGQRLLQRKLTFRSTVRRPICSEKEGFNMAI